MTSEEGQRTNGVDGRRRRGANVRRALEGIARRLRRETPIARGFDELGRRYPEIEACVLAVWPEANGWLEQRRKALRAADPQPK